LHFIVPVLQILPIEIIFPVVTLSLKTLVSDFLLSWLWVVAVQFVAGLVREQLFDSNISIRCNRVVFNLLPWRSEVPLGIMTMQSVRISILRTIRSFVSMIVVENAVIVRLVIEIY